MPTVVRTLVLVVAVAAGGALEAQAVRGEVTDPVTGRSVPGAVVLLLDGSDRTVAQVLSDSRGRYQLVSPTVGTFRVRALRIGFRPATSQPFMLATGAELELASLRSGEPIALDTIRVVGHNSCEAMTDRLASYVLWEQARTALAAARIATGARSMSARVVTYQRTIRAKNGDMLSVHATEQTGATRRPFVGISADSLHKVGYVVSDERGWQTFYAPDLDVLLSEQFLADHCFRIAPRSDRARVGIAFEPTRERARFGEIAGTVWLDRASSELRALEFNYENVEYAVKDAGAGGAVSFARLENGAWVVSHWTIRMPVVERRNRAASGLGGSRAQLTYSEVNEIREEGGVLALVTQASDTLFSAPPLAVTGTVHDSLTNAALPGVRVALRNSAIASSTDAKGGFRLAGMLPGRYVLELSTPELDALGATQTLAVTATEHSAPIAVRLAGVDLAVRRACPGDANGVIAGTVFRDSVAARDIRVIAEYQENAPRGGGTGRSARTVSDTTDLRGRYRLCGVPIETPVAVVAESDSGNSAPVTVRVARGRRVLIADLRLDRDPSRTAVFAGIVMLDVNGAPLPGAQVLLPDLPRMAFADDEGAFRISNIPAGSHKVVVRRLGYGQSEMTVAFAANQTVDRRLLLSRVVTLDTVAVRAAAEIPTFDEHRRIGLGKFWTRAELVKHAGRRLADLLSETAGADLVRGARHATWLAAGRGVQRMGSASCFDLDGETRLDSLQGKRCKCYALIYLDNTPLFLGRPADEVPNLNRIPISAIEAIEFYNGPAQTPLRYSTLNSNCGVLVIHTRRTLDKN